MVKKTIILLVLYFCSITLLVCGEKNILPNLTKSQEPEPVRAGCFWPLGAGAGAARKKIARAGAAWEKNQEPEPLEKSQEPEPEPLKNLPAPQPWIKMKHVIINVISCCNVINK